MSAYEVCEECSRCLVAPSGGIDGSPPPSSPPPPPPPPSLPPPPPPPPSPPPRSGTSFSAYASSGLDAAEGDLYTLAYDGSECSSLGFAVSTVAFHYRMGSDMGELRLTNAAGQVVWSLRGDQGVA